MKVCIPVKEDKGIESSVYGHFGSAPLFLIYDTESGQLNKIDNHDLNHEHGKCQPLNALGGQNIDAVLVGGIGGGALTKLKTSGIRVYKAEDDKILNNIELLKRNELKEFSADHSCSHHGCH